MKTYQYMWRMMLYRPLLYLFDVLTWVILTLVELAPGLLAKLFFDTLTGDKPYRFGVTGIVIILLVAEVAHLTLISTGAMLDTHHRFRMSALIRRNMLAHVLQRPGARAIPGSTGEALNTFRDDGQTIEDIMSWFVDQVSIAGFALASLVIMLRINTRIALITILPLLAVIAIARLMGSRVSKFRELSRRATERVTGALGEVLNSVQAIQVANAEKSVMQHLEGLNATRRKLVINDRLLTQILDSIYRNAGALGTGMILVLVAESMKTQQFSMGDFALFVYNLSVLTEFFANFGDFLAYYKQAGVSFMRLTEFIQGKPPEMSQEKAVDLLLQYNTLHLKEPESQGPAHEPLTVAPLQSLGIHGLKYHYPGCDASEKSINGIEDINLKIDRGQFVVITGRIGAGKTTLLRVLLGLLPAESGSITWNGQVVEDPASFFVPPHSAYTAQIPHLFSETLADNIMMGLPHASENLETAIHTAVLESDIQHLPAGLETMVGTRGVKLSGGQRQRVAAARMLVRNPELLVFDDLSSALDVHTERQLWERVFAGHAEGHLPTCLVVSHRHIALQRADQILVLEQGRVTARGDVE
ncbi:MAG: ABC transporter ATP-binding protein, partial [Anaerolineales bacterium]